MKDEKELSIHFVTACLASRGYVRVAWAHVVDFKDLATGLSYLGS